MSQPFVSIIMRSFNEAWALADTLEGLRRQKHHNWELIVIDSGSTDGSVDLIRGAGPAHFVQIASHEYNPSKVINHGMELARSEFCIFLNADATPFDSNWLEPLVAALQNPKVAAVFGRQVPRMGCAAVYACDYDRCFGPNRESASWDHFFSMVSSGLRKDVWRQRRFREDLQYAEDDEYTRWCRHQGYGVVYCPESVVTHSHNYTPAQAYKRSFGDARAAAASWPGSASDLSWFKTVALGWLRDVRKDLGYCLDRWRLGEIPHCGVIRWQQRLGKFAGFKQGWKEYRS